MRPFGYVGDLPDQGVAAAAKSRLPAFDQSHVDYLKTVLEIGSAPGMDIINQGPNKVYAYVCLDQAYRDVVAHIQSLVDQQKGTA